MQNNIEHTEGMTSLFYLPVEVPNNLSILQIHIEATKDGGEPSN